MHDRVPPRPAFAPPLPDVAQRSKPSLYTLQIGRGFAALLVLCYHGNLIIGLPKYYGVNPANIFMPGQAGVDYFFVLSGFVMVIAHWRDLGGSPDLAGFAWKRFRRLYPLLWIVLLPLMALIAIDPSFSPAKEVSVWDFLFALAIAPPINPEYVEPFLIVEWTLRYEIVFYVLFAFFLKSRIGFAILAFPLIAASTISLGNAAQSPFNFWISPYFLLFFLGMGGGYVFKMGKVGVPGVYLTAGFLMLAGCIWAGRSGEFPPLLTLGFGFASTLVIAGAAAGETGQPSSLARAFAFFGDASYSIYLVHYPLLSIFSKVAIRTIDSPLIAFILVTSLACIGGIGCHLLVERPLLRRIPRVLGKKDT